MPTNVGSFVVFGAIEQKWLQLGGLHSLPGAPSSNETPTFDGTGRFQTFQNGAQISWHPETGAQLVYGAIGVRWLSIGRERFGYPISDELGCPDGLGRFNHFRALQLADKPEASIFWTAQTGAQEIYGAIRSKWSSLGWERGQCGYPTGVEHDALGGGRVQRFQRGVISWTQDGGAVERVIGGDAAIFNTGQLASDLPLGGSAALLIHRNGDFLFTIHVHDSGFDNIDYALATVLLSPEGTPFLLEHQGHVEGTGAGFPLGSPQRNSDFSMAGNNPQLGALFDQIVENGSFTGKLSGVDKLQQAVTNILADALQSLVKAGIDTGLKALVKVVLA